MASRSFTGSEDEILQQAQRLRKKRGVVASSSTETTSLVSTDSGIGTPTKKPKSGDLGEGLPYIQLLLVTQSMLTLLLCNCLPTSFLIMAWTMVLCLLLPSSCFPFLRRGLTPTTHRF